MAVEDNSYNNNGVWPPIGSPLNRLEQQQHWSNFDTSMNALSFGFVATAILISMFLVMAIFERFLRASSPPPFPPSGRRSTADVESQMCFNDKLGYPSPKFLLSHLTMKLWLHNALFSFWDSYFELWISVMIISHNLFWILGYF
ncbi:hypothetical protein Lalb_Chr09g0327491 [Lupinus albus]|uniref:Uncharacterized protein n=1 Tax=Lupinus albus TaxID=3870 RepID=A0A6A4Q116_LUPAL|nr:hypothetical protein Lalb_Chr09g0327491 [Lupinus albus]